MNSLELFSGLGGLAKGLELSGFKHTTLVEQNKYAYASLCQNFEAKNVFFGDIKDFDLEQLSNIDIVAGGPPCQPFSLGGKHQGDRDRRDMFPYAIRAIEKLRPKAFIFENVKGLLRQTFSDYFNYIILRLTYPDFPIKSSSDSNLDWQKHLGELQGLSHLFYAGTKYNLQFKLINAANYGVPQTRERVVIIGIRSDLNCLWRFPPESHSSDRLFWDMYVTEKYWERHNISKSERPSIDQSMKDRIDRMMKKQGRIKPELMPWKTVRDVLGHLPDPMSKHGMSDHIFRPGARIYPGHTGSILDLPAKTIKAGDHGVPGGENMIRFSDGEVRYLTVFEAKRLQTFPDDFVIEGGWGESMRQIGNAVPVLLAEIMGHQLIKTLNGSNKQGLADRIECLAH